jgi:[acyl-carrier-protein] S-malonyltransferase
MIFVFPGQGSQYVGMGKSFYDNFPIAKQTFEEVNDSLKINLSDIIFNGPEDQLLLTENTQPAIMTVSIAGLRILLQETGKEVKDIVKYLAGHSLGEYSALYASSALSVRDIAKLLQFRGKAMQAAVPKGKGAMIALLKTNYDEVNNLLSNFEGCEISNDNSTEQVVVSGHSDKIDEFIQIAKDSGIKRVVKLNVSAPFHCKLMKPAADEMQKILEDIKFNNLNVPIISNVTAKDVNNPEEIKKLLVEQITKCVRWRETVKFCEEKNINKFLEIGPGNVLSKLIQRTHTNAMTYNLSDISSLKGAIEFISNGN